MGIATRMIRLCKADLHAVMDRMEDRVLLLKQYLREMEAALVIKRTRIDRLAAHETRVTQELVSHRDKITAVAEDIALAVSRERDDIARMLIRKVYPQRQTVEALEARLRRLRAEVEEGEAAYARQKAVFEEIGQRAAVVANAGWLDAETPHGGPVPGGQPSGPSEAEIELELLQHKEALAAGRSS